MPYREGAESSPTPGFRQSPRRTLAEAGAIVLALGLLVLLVRGCGGWAADAIVEHLPPSTDAAMGRAAAEAIRAQHGQGAPPDPARVARVERVFGELRAVLRPEESRVLVAPRVTVLDDPTVNAFALPGGEVFVLTGLLDRPGTDDAELRGVLAHELGHAVLRHGVRAMVRDGVTGLALSYVLGDMGAVTAVLVAGAARFEGLRYGRSMEDAADRFGVELLRRGGYGPDGLARFLEGLGSQPVPELLSTHPDPVARARAIRATGR